MSPDSFNSGNSLRHDCIKPRGGDVKGRTFIIQCLRNIGFGNGWLPFADLVNETNALWSMTQMHKTVSKSHSVNDRNEDWSKTQVPRRLLNDLVNDRNAIWSMTRMQSGQ